MGRFTDREATARPPILFGDIPGRITTAQTRTITDLCAEHLGRVRRKVERKRNKARTLSELEQLYRTKILPKLGSRSLAEIDEHIVELWHAEISQDAPVRANRAVAALRAGWRLAQRWKWVSAVSSPFDGCNEYMNPESPKERVLTSAERLAMMAYLANEELNPRHAHASQAIQALALTGARKNEILHLTWPEVYLDVEPPELRLQDSKTGAKTIALSADAVALFRRVKPTRGPFVFGALDYRTVWFPMREAIGAPDITLHDLRRTFCTVLAEQNISAEDVAAILGQKTVAVQKRHYRHISAQRKQELANLAAAALQVKH